MKCAELSLGIIIEPLGQDYNDDPDHQEIAVEYARGYRPGDEEERSWWEELNDDSSFPIYQYCIVILGVIFFALIVGVLCRCCAKKLKKRNKITKDGDFSLSEEERRATVVSAHVLNDVVKRNESLSRSSVKGYKSNRSNRSNHSNFAPTIGEVEEYYFPPNSQRNMLRR